MPGMGPESSPLSESNAPPERAYNHAVAALDILYELATIGSFAAKAKLEQIAEIAGEAAGKLGRYWGK